MGNGKYIDPIPMLNNIGIANNILIECYPRHWWVDIKVVHSFGLPVSHNYKTLYLSIENLLLIFLLNMYTLIQEVCNKMSRS